MLIRLRPSSELALYDQIAAQLRRAIQEGKVAPGERLPSARELAHSLDVNMHTVLRAYEQLKQEGLVDMRRGRGVLVLQSAPDRSRLLSLAREFLGESRRQGLSLADAKKFLTEVYE